MLLLVSVIHREIGSSALPKYFAAVESYFFSPNSGSVKVTTFAKVVMALPLLLTTFYELRS